MKKFLYFVVATVFVLIAGGGLAVHYFGLDQIQRVVGSDEPRSVARRFWSAVLDGRIETASWYMVPAEGLVPALAAQHESDEVVIGNVTQQDGYQFIDTTLILTRNGGTRIVKLKTVMVPDNAGEWLVDFWSSQQTSFDVGIESGLQQTTALLMNAAQEFPLLIDSAVAGGDSEIAAAEEQVNSAFAAAKEKILSIYHRPRRELSPQNSAQEPRSAGVR